MCSLALDDDVVCQLRIELKIGWWYGEEFQIGFAFLSFKNCEGCQSIDKRIADRMISRLQRKSLFALQNVENKLYNFF
jgi:hypothetical protein